MTLPSPNKDPIRDPRDVFWRTAVRPGFPGIGGVTAASGSLVAQEGEG